MSTPALTYDELASAWRSLRGMTIAVCVGLLALGLLFHVEVGAAVHTWIASTAYNHCFLVIPIAAYLAWDRRATLHRVAAAPMPLAALLGVPLGLAWLAAERLGIMEGRQLVAISFVELLAFSVLGPRLWWRLAGPLLYLYFLVPFGEFLTPKLQDITTDFLRHGLQLLQIPAYIDGYTIEIPEGTFYVAEACAGLRFLIASVAFGFLYALLMYRSPLRRLAFIVASIIVPIIANGFRAIGIVVLGHVLGSAQAAATDHVLYGWIFFSLVILLLIMLGLPFRQDEAGPRESVEPTSWPTPMAGQLRAALLASGIVFVLAAISPVLALQLNRAAPTLTIALPALDFGPHCSELPLADSDLANASVRGSVRRVACDGLAMDVLVESFPAHSTAAPVLAELRRLSAIPNSEEFETVWLPVAEGQPRIWRLTRTPQAGPEIALGLWIDGRPAAGGMATRLHLAWTSLAGARIAPVVVAVVPDRQVIGEPRGRQMVEAQLASLLANPALMQQVQRLGAAGK